MWNSRCKKQHNGHRVHFFIEYNSSPVSYKNVINAWQQDDNFRSFFIELLNASSFKAFRWETPPLTVITADQPFEFVLIHSPALANRTPDPKTFSKHFKTTQPVVTFTNLSNDARLVVPCPKNASADYGHLGAFTRQAPLPQQHALWTMVGQAMAQRRSQRPVWLSTAGGGVAWLHVRLDDYPKYYHYTPYRSISG